MIKEEFVQKDEWEAFSKESLSELRCKGGGRPEKGVGLPKEEKRKC